MTALAGKIVLLTGASRGIGVFIARALAQEQAIIVGVARSAAKLDEFCSVIQRNGGQALGISFDLTRIEHLPNLLEQIQQRVGTVDIVINNAAIEIYRAFRDYTTTELQSILTLNLLAAMELSRLLLPSMLTRNSGHIINISSLAGKKGPPYNSIYAASKAGLLMWSDALRQELTGTGVKISVICPGYVAQSGMSADTGVPLPRLAGISQPNDVAQAVLRSLKQNQTEVILNQDPLTELLTRSLLAVCQFAPRFGDSVYRWMRLTQFNRLRVDRHLDSNNLVKNVL